MNRFEGNNFEQKQSPERGSNVTVSIDLIRHPEKDPKTGKLTEAGKEEFFTQLQKLWDENSDQYDTIKFYVSPLSRGQEAKEPIGRFLEVNAIPTTVRNKEELVGRMKDIGPDFKAEMTKILEEQDLLTASQLAEVKQRDATISAHEPATKDFETQTNELLIRDYFDKPLPASSISGKELGEPIGDLIHHFSKMASRLKSNSRVKLILVGHSGITEHFIKQVYLQNNPDSIPETVDVQKIGGLLEFGKGPEILIHTDGAGENAINLKFKDLDLEYKYDK